MKASRITFVAWALISLGACSSLTGSHSDGSMAMQGSAAGASAGHAMPSSDANNGEKHWGYRSYPFGE